MRERFSPLNPDARSISLSLLRQDEDCASADMVLPGLALDIVRVQSRPCHPIPVWKMFKLS